MSDLLISLSQRFIFVYQPFYKFSPSLILGNDTKFAKFTKTNLHRNHGGSKQKDAEADLGLLQHP